MAEDVSQGRKMSVSRSRNCIGRGGLGRQVNVALGEELSLIVKERADQEEVSLSEEVRRLVWVGLAALDAGHVHLPKIAREIVIVNRAYAGKR